MVTPEGALLVQKIRQNVDDLNNACAGIDEATANRAPAPTYVVMKGNCNGK